MKDADFSHVARIVPQRYRLPYIRCKIDINIAKTLIADAIGLDLSLPCYCQKQKVELFKGIGHSGKKPPASQRSAGGIFVSLCARLANEESISIQPAFISHQNVPNVVLVPIADAGATWDLFVAWQPDQLARSLLGPAKNRLAEGQVRGPTFTIKLHTKGSPPYQS